MPEYNTFLSLAVPQTLTTKDRRRIAIQIIAVIQHVQPNLKLKDIRVLDVGSSSGEVAQNFCDYVQRVECLDVDKHALATGQKKFAYRKNLTFTHFDGEHIPFGNNVFDVVIIRRVIECANNPQRLVDEIYRVLKSGGLVYFESHNILWPDPAWDWFAFIPPTVKKLFAVVFGKKKYYFATYRNYWQLKKLFRKFHIVPITARILKNPMKFKFTKLGSFAGILSKVPLVVLEYLTIFAPTFIWVLTKEGDTKPK